MEALPFSINSAYVLSVTNAVATWANANNVNAEEEDPDGDYLSNIIEFALGTDPNSRDSLPEFKNDGTTGTVTFPKNMNRSGVTLEFQTSSNLEVWTTRNTEVTGVTGSIQTHEFSFDITANPEIFWRFRALDF